MAHINKITLCFFLLFAVSTYAQTYPKYTTQKVKDTVFAKAEKEIEAIVADNPAKEELPADFMALIKKASQQYKDKKFEDAVKTYTEALEVSPDDKKYFVLHMRAFCYSGKKDNDKAIEDCTTAMEKTKLPHDNALGSIYFTRSLAYKERKQPGDDEKACADHKKARELGFVTGQPMPGFTDCVE
jgi:tetratricopeptide (TPR) repeat protein